MHRQIEIDFNPQAACAGRDSGMRAATDRADMDHPAWRKKAGELLAQFITYHDEFMTEDLRLWAHKEVGLPYPPDSRAWGSIIAAAVRSGMIVCSGYAPMKSKNCHANPKAIWKVVRR